MPQNSSEGKRGLSGAMAGFTDQVSMILRNPKGLFSGEIKLSAMPGTDIMLAAGVIMLLSILVIPLPTVILDLGLALSITSSVLILMVALFLDRPLDFTSFPTLLLLTTMFRLSLEVATTRLVLSHGNEGTYAAGHVVAAFGGFLMGGDVIIGGIVFCILLVVNFMVITKGSGRIAEVSARFFLDSMPGKQMAIDADLASGSINERIARTKRKELEEESSFYGSMDGAAKFVRGDAIAGILITAINIIGGLTIGVLRHGMPVSDAAQTFTTLTIGDGLVSQIPALLVSLAAGIVVTKGGTSGSADVALFRQLGGSVKPLGIASVLSAAFAFMPGLPALPFLVISVAAGAGAYMRYKMPVTSPDEDNDAVETAVPATQPITDLLKVDVLRLEVGFSLIPLASGDNAPITEQIKALRRNMAKTLGIIAPSVRIQDNIQLGNEEYVIRLREIEVARGEVHPERMLAILPDESVEIPGIRTKEPSFNLPAVWIEPERQEQAESAGCTVVDPASVIVTNLSQVMEGSLDELLSYPATQDLLDGLPQEEQRLVNELIPSQVSVSTVQKVLQGLLSERVSVRNLPVILEAIQDGVGLLQKGFPHLLAHVRVRLSRQICSELCDASGTMNIMVLSPELETRLSGAVVQGNDGPALALPPDELRAFVGSLNAALAQAASQGVTEPVVVVASGIRVVVRSVVERVRPSIPVLAQSEIFPRTRLQTVATVK